MMMSLDGLPFPVRGFYPGDLTNPYRADSAARMAYVGKPLVKGRKDDTAIRVTGYEPHAHSGEGEGSDEGERQAFSDEEAEQIRLFARMRGVAHFVLDPGVRYAFRMNVESDCVELVNLTTDEVVLRLQPDEMRRLSERLQRYADSRHGGLLTDRCG